MATLALLLDKRNKKTERWPVVIRISHKQETKYIQTGYHLSNQEWDEDNRVVQKPYPNVKRANLEISTKFNIAERYITDTPKSILKNLTVFDIVKNIENIITEKLGIESPLSSWQSNNGYTCLFNYSKKVVDRLKKAKRDGYAQWIEECIAQVKNYVDKDELNFKDINLSFLKEYEAYCQGKEMEVNAYGAYMRAIRMLYNEAIRDSDTEVKQDWYPFGRWGYSIKVQKGKKRAVKENIIDLIKGINLENDSELWNHRNYFLLIFYCRGINFIDLAFMERESIKVNEQRLIYQRKKTKKQFNIRLNTESLEIFRHYLKFKFKGNLVLPILDDLIHIEDSYELMKKYKERLRNHNKYLKKLAKLAEINVNLTSYVARHSFATLAKRKGLSVPMIADMLGHSDSKITEAYLAEFEYEELDQAAEKVYS